MTDEYTLRHARPDDWPHLQTVLSSVFHEEWSEGARALEAKLVPLAKEVNALAVRGLPREQVEAARAALLAIISNLQGERP